MYRCILAPVDGTAFGEHGLRFAAMLARRSGAVLHLVHVHEAVATAASMETLAYRGAWNDIVREQEAGYLEGLAERLTRSHAIRVETRIVEGQVAAALAACARDCGAGLVVMSTHGRSGLGRLWHNRVTEQLARETGLPVLLVRPGDVEEEAELVREPELRRFLIPLHGTSGGGAVMGQAIELGRLFRARFTLLQVVLPAFALGGRLKRNPAELHHELMRAQTAARQYANSVAERMRGAGLEVEALVRFAPDTAAAIVGLMASRPGGEPFDMIVMESRGHHLHPRFLSGPASEMIARRVRVPVLAVQ